ncbi:MAG: FimV/HubP family polar landmark protein, partial [Gemmatimonadota bacterium]
MTAGALGLGEITLRSALNQPLVAEIPVTANSADELNQLSVQLAPAATFERFGLDRPRFLDDLSFKVTRDGARTLVRVTSTQPVSEPFVSLLLDVAWPQGRLLREYTVLLDPPTFARPDSSGPAATGQGAAAQRTTPPAAAGPEASAPVIRRAPAPTGTTVGVGTAGAATGSLSSGPDGSSYGPVRSNETLWRISERLRADSNVTVNQMMMALYRANPEAFSGNINRLRRGAILRLPRGKDLADISTRQATNEVLRQDQEWRGAASSPSPVPARLQLVPPTEQPAAKAPGTGGIPSPAAAAERAALEQELAEKQRLLTVKDSQLKALQDRVSQLEAKTAAPAPTEQAPVVAPVESPPTVQPEAGTEAVGKVPAESSPAVEERTPAVRPPQDRTKGGGFLSSLTGLIFNGVFLVSAAAVLLVGLFLIFARRRMATADEASHRFDNDFRGDVGGGANSTQPMVRRDGYSVEEAATDRTQSTPAVSRAPRDTDAETALERTISTEGAVELDQADVVAEADFHMAYGLYDQAAELLSRALRDSPDRRDLRLKLLEVFFIWENKTSFLKEAQAFQRQLRGAADPDWNKVVIMGKQICPGEALFSGAVGTTGDVGLDLGPRDDKGSVDISFDEGGAESPDLDLTGARQGRTSDLLDFDLATMDAGATEGASLDATGLMETKIAPGDGGGSGTRTAEVPTVEARFTGDYSPTMETPTIETATVHATGAGTLETPTLESAVPGPRSPAVDSRRASSGDQTEEINLEDLGLDLTGLDQAAGDLGTGVHGSLESGDSGEVYDLGAASDESPDLLEGLEVDATAEMREMALDEGTLDLPAFGSAMAKSAADRDSA